jgi:hypothetical protein
MSQPTVSHVRPRETGNAPLQISKKSPQSIPPQEPIDPVVSPPSNRTQAPACCTTPGASESSKGNFVGFDAPAPISFLARVASEPLTPRSQLEDGKRLLFHFIEELLQIKLLGLQSGFSIRPDSILFIGPHGSTLAVDINILLEPMEIARTIVRSKIEASLKAFAR